jgi:hypothetical protein
MIKRELENWNETEELDGLLFLALTIDEMTSIFTIDSYRAPVFNSHSLCEEFFIVNFEVNEGFLHERSIKPIIEELVWSLNEDPVAQSILDFRFDQIVHELEIVEKSEKYSKSESLISSIKTLLDQKYFDETRKQIIATIKNPKDKEKISRLAKILISELIFCGYSREYIRQELMYHFFQNQQITAIDQIVPFLDEFSFKPGKWEVIFRGNQHFAHLKNLKMNIDLTITDEKLTFRTMYPQERKFYESSEELEKYPIYIQFKQMEALDPYHARQICEQFLESFNNLGAYSIHKENLNWHSQAIVYSHEYTFFKITDQFSPIENIKDSHISALTPNILNILPIIQSSNPQFNYYTHNSLSLHSIALQSKNPENQLMNLWTALETLVPPPTHENIRIVHFLNSFSPFLGREYVQKLIGELLNELKHELGQDLNSVFSKLSDDLSEFEKCAAIVAIKDNKPLREELYKKLGRNLLIKHKIFTLMINLNRSDNILNLINLHNKRIEWHLQCIYRSRNLIVHKGNKLGYINQLVENIHLYYHTTIDQIQKLKSKNENIESLDTIFNFVKIEHQSHLDRLKKLKETQCDSKNFRELLFCD